MAIDVIRQGTIWQTTAGSKWKTCSGPRTVILDSGCLVCTFMVQSQMGVNDLVPMQTVSHDGGLTWSKAHPVWPHLQTELSMFCSVSRAPSGYLSTFGIAIPIDVPGETFWSDATQGMKQDELFWARSNDEGATWSEPRKIPMPIPGSAEAPGPMCITMRGRWIACYSPYNTFDPELQVDRRQVLAIYTDDFGRSWKHTSMLKFSEDESGGAEAWVIELGNGKLLGAAWHTSFRSGVEYENAYSLSCDGGDTWSKTRPTGIQGQSVGLAPLGNDEALMIYNQRRHAPVGVWLARIRPTEESFGVKWNQPLWLAETATRKGGSADHPNWMDYAFGEPSITSLHDGTWLAAFWRSTPSGGEIQYVKLSEGSEPAETN